MLNHLFRLFLLLLLFSSLTAVTAVTQKQAPLPEQLRAAMDRGEYPKAEQILRDLMATSSASFTRNNYDYLLARLLEWRRADAQAMTTFQRVISRNSPLAGYALWHQAEIARVTENLSDEQKLLQKFIAQNRDHLFYERAIRRLGVSFLKANQPQAAINTFRMLSGTRRDVKAAIGEAQLALGQNEAARLTFETVLASGS